MRTSSDEYAPLFYHFLDRYSPQKQVEYSLILTYSNKDENSEFLSKTFRLKVLKCETEEHFL